MSTTEAATAPQTIEEYQAQVRAEALRVAKEMSWCDDGLNKTLRNLGLPEKQTYRIPLEIVEKRIVYVNVMDAATEEEARAKVTAEEYLKANVALYGVMQSAVVAETKSPDEQVKGDMDTTYARRRQCEDYDRTTGSGMYCTRERGHDGTQHIAGNGETVHAVWPTTTV